VFADNIKLAASKAAPATEIAIAFKQKVRPVSFNQNLPLSIEIRNTGSADVVRNSVIEILSGDFYEKVRKEIPSIPKLSKKVIEVELRPTENASIDSLPEIVKV